MATIVGSNVHPTRLAEEYEQRNLPDPGRVEHQSRSRDYGWNWDAHGATTCSHSPTIQQRTDALSQHTPHTLIVPAVVDKK